MPTPEDLLAYYERDLERDRLDAGLGVVEFERTIELVSRTLPKAPAVVADIGGGPGRYTDWLVDQGYQVVHRDIVAHHVEQVEARYGDAVDTAIGDAIALDLDDASVDAALLLGPLYHLPDPADRHRAIDEAARVTKAGGMVYGAAISRWATRAATLVLRQYVDYPQILDMIDELEATGVMDPVFDGSFNSYVHTPDGLREEFDSCTRLDLAEVLPIEGVASLLMPDDVEVRLSDRTDRAVLFETLRALEHVPDLLGVSAHLLAIARRS